MIQDASFYVPRTTIKPDWIKAENYENSQEFIDRMNAKVVLNIKKLLSKIFNK
ncbi:MAG: hypothetical protein K6B75_00500 [Lachnospiraceae bacterium]|nr:hypothetical protein [Lachnospiraceae bacterium]